MLHVAAYAAFYLLSMLPYAVLYVLSDATFFVVYHILRYRRSLVWRNLTSAMPESGEEKLRRIEREFFRWQCDYFFESLKMMTISRSELLKHIEFRGVEAIEESFDRGKACAAILGHYGNWEMMTALGLMFKRHNEAVVGLVYIPKNSQILDRVFIKIRQNMGGLCVPKQDVLRYLVSFRNQGLMNIFGYIADHEPDTPNTHLRLNFLNHDTTVITGAERLMRNMDNTVFYVDTERPSRGKYIYTFKLITDNAAALPEHEVTRRFFAMLEQTVRREPSLYLWSHDRWQKTPRGEASK